MRANCHQDKKAIEIIEHTITVITIGKGTADNGE